MSDAKSQHPAENKKKTKRKKAEPQAKPERGPGQPTKYKPEYNVQVKVLTEKGFTDKEIAKVFSVKEQTINNWKIAYPLFFESLKAGKVIADQKVVQSLYERALGYSHPEVHITNYQGKITKTQIIKHYPPDPTSMIFWLKNRVPDEWRDKQSIEHSGNVLIGPPEIG